MCIRDRAVGQRHVVDVHAGRSACAVVEHAEVERDRLAAKACLLYTSDAADDLLCVDLGGRRILKKKKNNNTTTNHTYPRQNSKHPDTYTLCTPQIPS